MLQHLWVGVVLIVVHRQVILYPVLEDVTVEAVIVTKRRNPIAQHVNVNRAKVIPDKRNKIKDAIMEEIEPPEMGDFAIITVMQKTRYKVSFNRPVTVEEAVDAVETEDDELINDYLDQEDFGATVLSVEFQNG